MRKKGKRVTGVKRRDLSKLAMVAGGEKKITQVILDDLVYQWVGIGWVCEGSPTAVQRRTLPIVVD